MNSFQITFPASHSFHISICGLLCFTRVCGSMRCFNFVESKAVGWGHPHCLGSHNTKGYAPSCCEDPDPCIRSAELQRPIVLPGFSQLRSAELRGPTALPGLGAMPLRVARTHCFAWAKPRQNNLLCRRAALPFKKDKKLFL